MRLGPRAAAAFVILALACCPLAADALPSTLSFLSISPSPSDPEGPVTVTVAVAAGDAGADGGGAGLPTGSVLVTALNTSDRCTADLDAGVGTCVLSIASIGEVGIAAQYTGDPTYDPSVNSASHAVAVPSFTIAGPSETVYDAAVAIRFNGLPATGTVEVFVDGVSQQRLGYGSDGGVPSGVTLYLGPNDAPGCHSISAVNDDASAPPLGIFLDPMGIVDAASPCKAAVVSGGVTAASIGLGPLQPDVSVVIEVELQEAMAATGALPETLLLAQLDVRSAATLGGATPPPIAAFDLAANVGPDAGAVVQATFFLSGDAGNAGADSSAGAGSGAHALLYFDENAGIYRPIQPAVAELATDGGSVIIATFNAASDPSLTQLHGTIFLLVFANGLGADGGATAGASDAEAGEESDAGAVDATVDVATGDATVEDATADATADATTSDSSHGGSGLDAKRDGSPPDSGAASGGGNVSGCGCRAAGRTRSSLPPLPLAALATLVVLLARRTRRASGASRSRQRPQAGPSRFDALPP
jgi:hypothetical protein